MRRALLVFAAVTALWMLGSVWYYDCKIKRVCGPSTIEVVVAAPTTDAVEVADIAPTPATLREPPQALVFEPVEITVRFGRKSTELLLSPEAEAALPKLVEAALQGAEVLVTGHADARGKPELKAELSLQRAEILRDWLIARGVPATAIVRVESREDREPVADDATSEGRALNRRAVARLINAE